MPVSMAIPALFGNPDETLLQARSLNCILKNSQSATDLRDAVDSVLANPKLTDYTSYALWDLVTRSRSPKIESKLASELSERIRNDENYRNFLKKKILNPSYGVLPKMEWYSQYSAVKGDDDVSMRTAIVDQAKRQLVLKLKEEALNQWHAKHPSEDLPLKDRGDTVYVLNLDHAEDNFRSRILTSLVEHHLVNFEDAAELVKNHPDTSYRELGFKALESFQRKLAGLKPAKGNQTK